MTQSTKISILDFFLVYTDLELCWKAMTQSNTLKEESTNKIHNNDNYNLV